MCCVTGQFLSTAASLLCEIVAPFNLLSQFWSCLVVLDGGLGAGVGAGIGCAVLVAFWWCYYTYLSIKGNPMSRRIQEGIDKISKS
jgi:hypothetical protein